MRADEFAQLDGRFFIDQTALREFHFAYHLVDGGPVHQREIGFVVDADAREHAFQLCGEGPSFRTGKRQDRYGLGERGFMVLRGLKHIDADFRRAAGNNGQTEGHESQKAAAPAAAF